MPITTDLKKPVVILSVVLVVIGWVLASFFYFQSRRVQRLTYVIEPQISKVYSSEKQAPNLIFLKSSGEKITKDVFLVTVHLWNSGTLPIEPQDIREPVKFTITNCEEIIDYDIVAQTNPNIVNFSLSPGSDQKSLVLSWSHLDPNNGVKFHVFYIGPSEPEILLTGNILGRTSFYRKTIDVDRITSSPWTIIRYLLMIPVGIIMAFYIGPRMQKTGLFKKHPRFTRFMYYYGLVGGVFVTIAFSIVVFVILVFTASPPTY